jgi:hypothetical protein
MRRYDDGGNDLVRRTEHRFWTFTVVVAALPFVTLLVLRAVMAVLPVIVMISILIIVTWLMLTAVRFRRR